MKTNTGKIVFFPRRCQLYYNIIMLFTVFFSNFEIPEMSRTAIRGEKLNGNSAATYAYLNEIESDRCIVGIRLLYIYIYNTLPPPNNNNNLFVPRGIYY